jgi:hypothetical protein
MLLQTNSYIVPKDKRAEHSRLIHRFRQTLLRLGCDHFEVYEQVGANWSNSESNGRYVQILRFLDRKHQLAVQAAERTDPTAQAVIADFVDLINFPYQQQQGLFAVGFYTSVLPIAPKRGARGELVSTVEHEIIDDPEAEQPYEEPSDASVATSATDEGAVADHATGNGMTEESEPVATAGDSLEQVAVQSAFAAHQNHPAEQAPIPAETANEAQTEQATDDFLDMISAETPGEANNAETFEEDHANGFIDAEVVDGTAAPAHPAKDHPTGW